MYTRLRSVKHRIVEKDTDNAAEQRAISIRRVLKCAFHWSVTTRHVATGRGLPRNCPAGLSRDWSPISQRGSYGDLDHRDVYNEMFCLVGDKWRRVSL